MSNKTDDLLLKHLFESMKREVDADEAVWRTMPFFVALLGLAITLMLGIFRDVSNAPLDRFAVIAWALITAATFCFAASVAFFFSAIRLRRYRYLPTDSGILSFADQMHEHFEAIGVEDPDAFTEAELRRLLIEETAAATTANRVNNRAKAAARSQALLFAALGFVLAFFAETSISLQAKLAASRGPVSGGKHGQEARSEGRAGAIGPSSGREASSAASLGSA